MRCLDDKDSLCILAYTILVMWTILVTSGQLLKFRVVRFKFTPM